MWVIVNAFLIVNNIVIDRAEMVRIHRPHQNKNLSIFGRFFVFIKKNELKKELEIAKNKALS